MISWWCGRGGMLVDVWCGRIHCHSVAVWCGSGYEVNMWPSRSCGRDAWSWMRLRCLALCIKWRNVIVGVAATCGRRCSHAAWLQVVTSVAANPWRRCGWCKQAGTEQHHDPCSLIHAWRLWWWWWWWRWMSGWGRWWLSPHWAALRCWRRPVACRPPLREHCRGSLRSPPRRHNATCYSVCSAVCTLATLVLPSRICVRTLHRPYSELLILCLSLH